MAEGRVGLDLLEFVVLELAFLLQHLVVNADLADVVQEGDVVVFVDVFLAAAKLPREDGGVLGDAHGMTVGVAVLHIDGLGKCFRHLIDKDLLFALLFHQLLRLLLHVAHHREADDGDGEKNHQKLKPPQFVHGVHLDDANPVGPASGARRVVDLHVEVVGAAA